MNKDEFYKEVAESAMSKSVLMMEASTDLVVADYRDQQGKLHGVCLPPECINRLSLVVLPKAAWENLGIAIVDHRAVGIFFEMNGYLHCAVLDGESVLIRKVNFPFYTEMERVKYSLMVPSVPSFASIKNSQQLAMGVILNCILKLVVDNLVQRLFLPWGSVPVQNAK